MTFASQGNHPSIQWMYDRVKEGTPTLAALTMMREEGYQFNNTLFRDVYRVIRRYVLVKRRARSRYYYRREKDKRTANAPEINAQRRRRRELQNRNHR